MIDQFYGLLNKLGFIHPLHPPITHGPIGSVIVAFIFAFAAIIWSRKNLLQAAYYAVIVAFLLYFPTIIVGILDWQHYFSGALIFPIKMKIGLALLLLMLLSISLFVGRSPQAPAWLLRTLYLLCLLNVLGLGYFGGQLVYEGRVPQVDEVYSVGRKIFINRCSGCHVNGGNILYPNLPLRSAPQLASYEEFVKFVRKPRMPDGTIGPMPAFNTRKLNEQQMRQLYDYVMNGLAKPTRSNKRK